MTTRLLAAMPLAFELTWDPFMRGFLSVAVGVIVLCGSTYLLLGTNVGSRLGFLIAFAGLMGWMTIMGLQWWVYGIGLVGDVPSWRPIEIVNEPSEAETEAAALGDGPGPATWEEGPEGDTRGARSGGADSGLIAEGSSAAPYEATSATRVSHTSGAARRESPSACPAPHPAHTPSGGSARGRGRDLTDRGNGGRSARLGAG
jgi:hypothetical protein